MFLRRRLTFNGLHGGIFQKTELFITAAMKTSNPTWRLVRHEVERYVKGSTALYQSTQQATGSLLFQTS
jgi:hypothetical protein